MLNSFLMPITILDKPIWSILLNLVGGIYDFICYVYDIFYTLCRFNLFGEGDYQHIVSNIYIILGILMTFVLAYSLLRAVINPDEFAKGETSFPKLAKNVVISLAIIVLLPTAFDVAFKIQDAILNRGVVENLILGYSASNTDNSGLKIETSATNNINNPDADPSGGRVIAYYTYKAFFVPNTGKDVCKGTDEEGCRQYIKGNGDVFVQNGDSLVKVDSAVLQSSTFSSYADFSEAVAKGQIKAYVLLLPVVGFFELIVLVNFTIDMALRVVKLAFYQIIAPIPVICRIIPGGKLKDTFSKWLKQVISLFFEVFVRIASLSFGVLLIRIVVNNFIEYDGAVFEHKGIIGALLIMAVIMFVKQMPKLIGDLFGLDTGGMKLGLSGLTERLAMGGALTAGVALSGGAGMLAKNGARSIKNVASGWKENGWKGAAKATARGLGSTAAGMISGAGRGFWGARNAKNFKDMSNASSHAINEATRRRDERAENLQNNAGANWVETAENVAYSAISNSARRVGQYLGVTDDLSSFKPEKDFYAEVLKIDDDMDQTAVKLMGRDAVKNSASLMQTATGGQYSMSLAAMQKRVSNMERFSTAMQGHQFADFQGNMHTINNENDYAVYQALMEQQMNDAERKMKKTVKTYACNGDTAGMARAIGIGQLSGGELDLFGKISNDAQIMTNLVEDNAAVMSILGERTGSTATTSGVHTWDEIDSFVTNVKTGDRQIAVQIDKLTRENARNDQRKNHGNNGGKH